MISATLRQLSYMAETMSWASIARETDIPISILNRYRTGAIDLDANYKRDIKNAFARVSYSRFRDAGFSVANARIYSQYRPEIASAYEMEMRLKIVWLTEGAVASKLNNMKLKVTQKNVDSIYDEMYAKIQEGMKRSSLTVSEQFDYGIE